MIKYLLQLSLDSLPFEQTYYPLGFALGVSSNARAVIEAASEEWGVWQPAFDVPGVTLRIEVSEGSGALPLSSEFHSHRHLFAYVADSRNFAVGDTRARIATVRLTSRAAEESAYLRYHFLDGVAYHMIESLYLTPIHAACVARRGEGVLLCGDSGSGKSSLAYACARRGWTYVTDDASYLVRSHGSQRMIIGNAHRIRLRPDAARWFSELAAYPPAMRGNGKLSLEIWTRTLPAITATPSSTAGRAVFLRRTPGAPARLSSMDKAEARAWCERVFYWWDPEVAAEQQAGLAALFDGIRVEALEYSDLEAAVDALEAG
jgi:hypothetical protein